MPAPVCGQSEADSLKAELKGTRGAQRARLLIELSGYTRQTDVREAISQVNEALRIGRRLEDIKLQVRSLRKLGFFYTILNRDTKVLEYYLEALELNKRYGYRRAEAAVVHQLGRFYEGQENYPRALEYYFRALRLREAEGDPRGSAETLYYIGVVYEERNEISQAIDFYRQSYNLSQTINNYRQMSLAASGVAILLQRQDSPDKALDYYARAMKAAKAINSTHAQASILLHMSSAYQDQQLFEKALALNNRQIKMARAEQSTFLEAQGLENLADLYVGQGNLERANQYFREAKSLYEAIHYPESPVIITNKLAQNFLAQRKVAAAVETSKKALAGARALGSLEETQTALQTLIKAYIQQEDFQKALQVQTHLMAVKDSLFNKEQERQIAQMQTRYETEQKEQEIALLQAKQERSALLRNALIGGLVLIVTIGMLIYNRQRLKIHKGQTELENIRLKEKQLEKDLEFKNKQLTTHSLHLVQKNEAMKELKAHIGEISRRNDGETARSLQSLKNLVDYSFSLDEDWEQFELYFEEVHSGFFDILKERYPDLTPNELRLSALVKLNLTSKEMATILGITSDSVKTARYRLRKKLGMETEENLTEFMMAIEKEASET